MIMSQSVPDREKIPFSGSLYTRWCLAVGLPLSPIKNGTKAEELLQENAALRLRLRRTHNRACVACGIMLMSLLTVGFAHLFQSEELGEAQEELKTVYEWRKTDQTELRKAQQELTEARKQLADIRSSRRP